MSPGCCAPPHIRETHTYYSVDTALMFQSVTHGAVTAALDNALNAKGQRTLSDVDRRPIMKDFFERLG